MGALAVRLNQYIRAVDAADSAERFGNAESLLRDALSAIERQAPPPALPPSALSTAHFMSTAAQERYERDHPPVPADMYRLEAALLWRLARLCWKRATQILQGRAQPALDGTALSSDDMVAVLFERGLDAVLDSLKLYEADADAHRYAGMLLYKCSKDKSELVSNSYKIRDHTKRAIEIRPHDQVLHHIMGRWCFNVADMPWYLRTLATSLFGAPPTSSYEEALSYLLQSDRLSYEYGALGPLLSNTLLIARTHFTMGRKAEAKEWLVKSLALVASVGEDPEDIEKQKELARKLGVPLKKQ